MTKSPTQPDPRTAMRRHDRAVTDEVWLRTFLERAPVGVLATVADEQPFVIPNLFVYDAEGHAIIFHTGRKGQLRSNIEANPRMSFCVYEIGRLLPADEALEFSNEYASVVVFGRVRLVTDRDAAARDLQLLLDKYAPHLHPGTDYRRPIPAEIKRTSVFRLQIQSWSGKRKEAADDVPGAYWLDPAAMLASLAAREE